MVTTQYAIDVEQIHREFLEDGFVVVRGLFSATEIGAIRAAFMDETADGPIVGVSDIPGAVDKNDPLLRYPRMMNPHNHPELKLGQLARQYLTDWRIHEIIQTLMGEEPLAAQTMFYFKPPGARGQELHQDNFYLRVAPGTCMAAWIAVDDADEENGTLKVVPQTGGFDVACPEAADQRTSFTGEYVPVPEGFAERHVVLRAGDCLFFNGSLIHGSGPNKSENRFRRSLINHYVPASSAELSTWYSPYRFDGTPVSISAATGGGPCGTTSMPAGPH